MKEKLQVSHLADLTACFAAMLEVEGAGYPLNFGTSQFVLKIYPMKVYHYYVDIFAAFFLCEIHEHPQIKGKKRSWLKLSVAHGTDFSDDKLSGH